MPFVTNMPSPRAILSALLVVAAACSGDSEGAAPPAGGAPRSGGAGASAAAGGQGGGPRAGGGAPGGPGGRQSPSITLAANDVITVAPGTIEDGVALTGDLRPIESVEVRSRIEGDLQSVLVREGQQVAAGQLLAQFESSEQESARLSAQADRSAAQADLSNATWTREQNASLFNAGAIAERDYKISEQAVSTARARLAASDARLRATGNQARDTRVLAPASGIIEKRLVEGGEHVSRGASLFTLVRNGTLELAAAVPSRQAAGVRVGQIVRFVADGHRFDGRVARLSPTIDPVTRALTVYAQVPNPGGLLRGGTFASGIVIARTLTNVVTVPLAAIRQSQDNGAPFVYRIDGKTVNTAPVQLGVVDDRQGIAQVTSGLEIGDKVIVGNVGILGRGMQVTMAGEQQRRQQGQR